MGRLADYIYGHGTKAVKIAFSALRNAGKTVKRFWTAITDTVKKGDGFDGLVGRLRKAYQMSVSDAKRIAQTETTRVENMARYDAARQYEEESGEKVYKTWICTFQNSRPNHIKRHGTRIPLEEPFETPSGPMMRPGDSEYVDLDEIINCRCYLIYDAVGRDGKRHGTVV